MPITKAKRRVSMPHYLIAPAIRNALDHLRDARSKLRAAGSKNAADYVARAMKSAEGALRHADRMSGQADASTPAIVIWKLPYSPPQEAIGFFTIPQAAGLLDLDVVALKEMLVTHAWIETNGYRAEWNK